LDSKIPPTDEPFTATNGVKIAIDQFLQAPVFTVLIFVFLGLLEGKQVDAIQKQLKNDYKETIIANCTYIVRLAASCVSVVCRRQLILIFFMHFRCCSRFCSRPFTPSPPVPPTTIDFFNDKIGKLWVPATVINIGFVPPILRVLVRVQRLLGATFLFYNPHRVASHPVSSSIVVVATVLERRVLLLVDLPVPRTQQGGRRRMITALLAAGSPRYGTCLRPAL